MPDTTYLCFLTPQVDRNKARVEAENADVGLDDKVQALVKIDTQIREMTAKSEKVAEEGEVEEAQQLLTQVSPPFSNYLFQLTKLHLSFNRNIHINEI